ncbi:PLD nuclease N-terminal domain-containing protein [Georgenia sp. H159]|uniref:PLD nuclease N-terminal domain-containing protein n=1 Tax=Georgenia sp. H159 TaxID=3076115 RepID=UPI002D7832D5|nr:PLDc N-terminal domain-containing protein [Georgenia sp. H159]
MRYLPFVLLLALVIYALVDCVRYEDSDMPVGLPKAIWVILIVVFPGAGALAWLVVSRAGRQVGRTARPGQPSPSGGFPSRPTPRAQAPRPVAPDDDPEFLASLDRPRRRPDGPSPEEPGAEEPQATSGPTDEGPAAGGASNAPDEDNGPTPRH